MHLGNSSFSPQNNLCSVLFVCVGYLEWPSRRDHYLITSTNQLANSNGHLIIPLVDLVISYRFSLSLVTTPGSDLLQ